MAGMQSQAGVSQFAGTLTSRSQFQLFAGLGRLAGVGVFARVQFDGVESLLARGLNLALISGSTNADTNTPPSFSRFTTVTTIGLGRQQIEFRLRWLLPAGAPGRW